MEYEIKTTVNLDDLIDNLVEDLNDLQLIKIVKELDARVGDLNFTVALIGNLIDAWTIEGRTKEGILNLIKELH